VRGVDLKVDLFSSCHLPACHREIEVGTFA
jgi:hypothetical protein